MEQANIVHRFVICVVLASIASLCIVYSAWPGENEDLKAAAKSLAHEIERSQFHKVYVADFLDPSGVRTEKGCFFASSFSTNIAKSSHNFEVVNRIKAQKQLNELHIPPQDLEQPELLSKAAQALGADGILHGSISASPSDIAIILTLRDVGSGKEVHTEKYHQKLQPSFENSFPAAEDANTHVYYFAGFDGVSLPKCTHCPDPSYTDAARRNKFQGNVLISVKVDERGEIRDARVVQDPGYGLAAQAVNILEKWKMKPSQDPEGNAVAVRVSVEITFRMYFGPGSY